MRHSKILDNLPEHDKTTVAMALLFQKLNTAQKNYIAAMSEGMLVSNDMLERFKDNQTNY